MSDLTGTRHLVRLILRRDRIRLPVWILGLTAMTGASSGAVQDLYDTPTKVAGYRATVEDSAASKLLNGTPYDVDNLGAITAYEVTATAGVIMALLVTFLVVRHTRAEEESGNAELLRSSVTGRHAPAAAVLVVATAASLLVGVLDTLVLVATGLPTSGSVLHGAALAGVGLAFTAVAVAAAQVASTARGALGLAGAVIAVLYLVRGIGSVREDATGWASPFGWQQGVRAYGDERWWPLLLLVGFTALVSTGAAVLTGKRDFGAGLVPARGGSPRASGSLSHPVGLAFRLQRGLLLGWGVGLTLTACTFGAVGREVVTMVESNPEMAELFGGGADDVVRGFFAFVIAFLCVVASAYTVSSALRLRAEEERGHAEGVLATGLSRTSWAVGSLVVTVLGTLVLLVAMGLGAGITHALVSGDSSLTLPLLGATLAQAPAVLLLGALAVLLHGLAPRWTIAAWAVFAFALLVSYLGELLSLPDWVSALSPFWHLPMLPVDDFTATPAVVIGVLALLAAALGVAGLRRRDLVPA